ncbi:hypothetical protein [Methylomonas koyamae]|uniref:Uncharacterized protein n=2 Tax=Methylomonas koyamae TaxID=702114 RepID=A0AA91DEK1_9GAMM|nr:hypothetical protein [Methylomonas koyamae]OAI28513.1 hypothetical protein A1356_06525 [Methylomonas koyamae]
MQAIDVFSLASHAGDYRYWPLQTRLLQNGVPTACYVPGYRLLHQFQTGTGDYLLICDWDCPFEEASEFVLLSPELRILARRSLGLPYASFVLDGVEIAGPDRLRLTYYPDRQWLLRVAAPFNRLPGFLGRCRLLHGRRRLNLRRLAGAE